MKEAKLNKIEERIINNIYKFRQLRRMTQQELNKALGRHNNYISEVERFKTSLRVSDYIKISKVLQVTLDELNS